MLNINQADWDANLNNLTSVNNPNTRRGRINQGTNWHRSEHMTLAVESQENTAPVELTAPIHAISSKETTSTTTAARNPDTEPPASVEPKPNVEPKGTEDLVPSAAAEPHPELALDV